MTGGARKTMRIGDVQAIGAIRVVCIPDWLLTRVGVASGTVGILLPAEAADILLAEMKKANVGETPDCLAEESNG